MQILLPRCGLCATSLLALTPLAIPVLVQTVSAATMNANVKDYGAAGDGVTDDSSSIQAAIDDTAPGGVVVIPDGTYIIGTDHGSWGSFGAAGDAACGLAPNTPIQSGLFVSKSNLTISGTGRGSVLKLAADAKLRIIGWTGANLTIEKLVFDGNGAARFRTDPTGKPYSWPCGLIVDALVAGHSAQGGAVIRDVETRNGIEDGLGMSVSPNFTVDSVYSHDNGGYAIDAANKNEAGGAGISLSGGANQKAVNSVVVGNTQGILAGFGSVGVDIEYNVSIGQCGWGMELGTSAAMTPPPQPDSSFRVRENWIENNGGICRFGALGIVGSQDGVFAGNNVVNNPFTGILITDPGAQWPATKNWQIVDNRIANNHADGIRIQNRSGEITLQGNDINDNGNNLDSQVVIDPSAMSGALNANWQSMNKLGYAPAPANPVAPAITADGVVNAASGAAGGISPGEILTIHGSNLGPAQPVSASPNSDGRFERILAGTRVLFDGVPGVILYSSVTHVRTIAPYYLYWKDNTSVQVEYNGVRSDAVAIPMP